MSKDPFSVFNDLKDFPGKREPVMRAQPKPVVTTWDARPLTYKVNGIPTEFFRVSHLAAAVNRSVRTIRHWEKHGIIPPAIFWAPLRGARSQGSKQGDRLYSRAQIEVVINAAKRTGVLKGRGNAPDKDFTRLIITGWLRLQAEGVK